MVTGSLQFPEVNSQPVCVCVCYYGGKGIHYSTTHWQKCYHTSKGPHLAYILELLLVQRSLWVALNAAEVVLLTWVLSSWHLPRFIQHQFVISLKRRLVWSFLLFKPPPPKTLIHRFFREKENNRTEVGE